MANISDYLEEALLNHIFRNVDFPRPGATIYVAIFENTKAEAELEANNMAGEITAYTGIVRPGTAFGAPAQVLDKATITNSDIVEYAGMPAVTVGYLALVDEETHAGGGNILYWAKLTADRVCAAGDECKFPVGNITVDLD